MAKLIIESNAPNYNIDFSDIFKVMIIQEKITLNDLIDFYTSITSKSKDYLFGEHTIYVNGKEITFSINDKTLFFQKAVVKDRRKVKYPLYIKGGLHFYEKLMATDFSLCTLIPLHKYLTDRINHFRKDDEIELYTPLSTIICKINDNSVFLSTAWNGYRSN